MEKAFEKAEELAGTIKEYINTKIDSVKLGIAEKSSGVIAVLVAGAIVAFVFLLVIIFAGIALSICLGEWIGKAWAGFLIVAGLYFFIGVIVWTAREKIIRMPVMNALVKQLFKNEENEED